MAEMTKVSMAKTLNLPVTQFYNANSSIFIIRLLAFVFSVLSI